MNNMFDVYDLEELHKNNPEEYDELSKYLCGRRIFIFDDNCPSIIEADLVHQFRNLIDKDFKKEEK
jgi:hypothetical protein